MVGDWSKTAPQPAPAVTIEAESTQSFEVVPHDQPILMKNRECGKGSLTSDNIVLAYLDIPDVANEFVALLHFNEFVALLHFGTSFELMEFLATQQIKVSQRMVEEHAERQMIERALPGTTESEDEQPLAKIGRMRNTTQCRMGIKLPPLNTALVEVHRELAMSCIGAKDMAYKNKAARKAEKLATQQLEAAKRRLRNSNAACKNGPNQPLPPTPSHPSYKSSTRKSKPRWR